jgi:hypothetical protein
MGQVSWSGLVFDGILLVAVFFGVIDIATS